MSTQLLLERPAVEVVARTNRSGCVVASLNRRPRVHPCGPVRKHVSSVRFVDLSLESPFRSGWVPHGLLDLGSKGGLPRYEPDQMVKTFSITAYCKTKKTIVEFNFSEVFSGELAIAEMAATRWNDVLDVSSDPQDGRAQ